MNDLVTRHLPRVVETLDELLLVTNATSPLFDTRNPTHHLFGADLCLSAWTMGLRSYVIPAFCYHNSTQGARLPEDYKKSVEWIAEKWRERLPIHTTCGTITGGKS